jgi:hypothetical protein
MPAPESQKQLAQQIGIAFLVVWLLVIAANLAGLISWGLWIAIGLAIGNAILLLRPQ